MTRSSLLLWVLWCYCSPAWGQQSPPIEEAFRGLTYSEGGYKSLASLNYGSGTPDFTCGSPSLGPTFPTYCVFLSLVNQHYGGFHGDFTFLSGPRDNGWLLHVTNPYMGGAVFGVDWHGTLWARGYGLQVQESGAGIWNIYSYVGIRGRSPNRAAVGDVSVFPEEAGGHQDGGSVFDVANGPRPPVLRVLDNGKLVINAQPLDFAVVDGGLRITADLPDGGALTYQLAPTP